MGANALLLFMQIRLFSMNTVSRQVERRKIEIDVFTREFGVADSLKKLEAIQRLM
jgi:hypothetical protein